VKNFATLSLGCIFCLAVSLFYFLDWYKNIPTPEQRVLQGKIVKVEEKAVGPFIRPSVVVKLNNSEESVRATFMVDGKRNNIPNDVSFFYPPRSGNEVQLIEETSSLVMAVTALILAFVCVGAMFYGRNGRP
jgi:hypothetical protein